MVESMSIIYVKLRRSDENIDFGKQNCKYELLRSNYSLSGDTLRIRQTIGIHAMTRKASSAPANPRNYPYTVTWQPEGVYLIRFLDFPGLAEAHDMTEVPAIAKEVIEDLISVYVEDGIAVPAPSPVNNLPFVVSSVMDVEPPAPKKRNSRQFGDLLKADMENPCIAHVVGDGTSFRQAVVAPVVGTSFVDWVITPRKGHLLNLLVERTNGQIIALCLIDDMPGQFHLDRFMRQLETVFPHCIGAELDTHELEATISKAVGCTVTLEETSLDANGLRFYSNAIPELAAAMLADIMKKSRPDTLPGIEEAQARVTNSLRNQLDTALEQFLLGLDAKIISAITRSGSTQTTLRYNQYRCLGNAMRHRRLQAAEAFPLIGTILVDKSKQYSSVRRAVDRKLPLTPALSKALKVPQEVIRWLIGNDEVTAGVVGICWAGRLGELAQYLSHICPEHRPNTTEDWFAFREFIDVIGQLETRSEGSAFLEKATATAGLLRQIGRIGWCHAKNRLEAMGAQVSGIADMADLIDEIVQVLAEHIGEGGTLSEVLHDNLVPPLKKLYFSIGINRQLNASLRWHQLMLEPDEAANEQTSVTAMSLHSWPAPFDGVLEIDGLVAVWLTNPQQLKDEGVHMQHCVRNYTDHCLYYGSTIVSFRRHDGARVSTAELNLAGNLSDSPRFEVRQHRGYKNAEPPLDAVTALEKLLPLINGREIASRRQSMYRALKERKAFRRDRPSVATDPQRIEKLKKALKVHVGYERFYEEALRVAGGS